MTDSHCHLADAAFNDDLDDVVRRAREAGVDRALCILTAHEAAEIARAPAVRAAWPAVRFAAGVHPHAAGDFAGRAAEAATATAGALAALLPDAVAVGEIGLDYHYDHAPRDLQRDVFAAQTALAVARELPLVIHTRDAMEDTVAVLREAGGGRARGVIHCFTGGIDDARLALDLGFYVSFAGIVTFPKAAALREAAAFVPADRLLVETDAPYLAPVPHRGKRNEPAWAAVTLAQVASASGRPPDDVARDVDRNFACLFAPPGVSLR